jgi:hypothetical protein
MKDYIDGFVVTYKSHDKEQECVVFGHKSQGNLLQLPVEWNRLHQYKIGERFRLKVSPENMEPITCIQTPQEETAIRVAIQEWKRCAEVHKNAAETRPEAIRKQEMEA